MNNENIVVAELNFIPNIIIQKREIKLPIFEEELDKYIDDYASGIETIDPSIFKQLFSGVTLTTGDVIVYKEKEFNVDVYTTPDNNKIITLKEVKEQKLPKNENV